MYVTCVCIYAGANVTKNQAVAAIFIAELQFKNIDKNMTYALLLIFKL